MSGGRQREARPHTMLAMVSVEAMPRRDGWECTVEVADPRGATRHTVDVSARDLARWGRSGEMVAQLVQRAFDFLLARESPSQILRRFQLSDIQRYFPEFDEEIRR
jgi:hypothetical protein